MNRDKIKNESSFEREIAAQEDDRTQQEVNFSAGFLLQIINGTSDPIFVKDRQHCWVLANDAYCNFIGRSGLSISYQIITQRHGGSNECVSQPGEGSEFIISILLHQE